jgi:hypothetical protein
MKEVLGTWQRGELLFDKPLGDDIYSVPFTTVQICHRYHHRPVAAPEPVYSSIPFDTRLVVYAIPVNLTGLIAWVACLADPKVAG